MGNLFNRHSLITSRIQVPAEMYESTLIIGATNVPNVLDIKQVQPGTLIVDDSGPHCFDPELAIQRLQQQEDILFTEGGVLQLPHPITQLWYQPRQLEKLKIPGRTGHPFNITGCVLSSLLSSNGFSWPLQSE